MMDTTAIEYDQDKLLQLAGIVGAGEFNATYEGRKAHLWAWLTELPNLTNQELFDEAKYCIYDSASCGRFRGNFEDVHCRATACYKEAGRRHVAAGHAEDCRGETIYSRAHAANMWDHGYTPTASGECHCEHIGAES